MIVSDNKYFNIAVAYDPNGPFNQPLTYSSTQTIPVVNKSSDYYLTVLKFNIPLDFVPLLIFPVVPNTNDILLSNVSTLRIGIMNFDTGINYDVPLLYTNPSTTNIAPIQNKITQVITAYYYVYSHFRMIDFFNTALETAFSLFALGNPADPRVIAGFVPFFTYDPNTTLVSLITHNSWIQPTQVPPTTKTGIFININTPARNFMDAFTFFNIRTTPNNSNFYFIVEDRGNNGYPTNTYPTPSEFLYQIQAYSTIGNWRSLKSILITTSTIPIVPESIPLVNNSNLDQSNTVSVIGDFLPQINNVSTSNPRESALYYPTSQYKLIDLISDLPLKKIEIAVFWQDKDNNIYPIFMSQSAASTIKLGFVKKSLYNSATLTLMK